MLLLCDGTESVGEGTDPGGTGGRGGQTLEVREGNNGCRYASHLKILVGGAHMFSPLNVL